MARTGARDFSAPDETRKPDKTLVELVNSAVGQIGRYTFQPGWRWFEWIKPAAKTDSCQTEQVGYLPSGGLRIQDAGDNESDITAGSAHHISPGHDAWNSGSEPTIVVEFQGAANYGKS